VELREHAGDAAIGFLRVRVLEVSVRSPASTCASGTRQYNAARLVASTVVVSPWVMTRSGLHSTMHRWTPSIKRPVSSPSLVRSHRIEIDVGSQPEDVEHLIEHLPVLRGAEKDRLEPGVSTKLANHRGHLDRSGRVPMTTRIRFTTTADRKPACHATRDRTSGVGDAGHSSCVHVLKVPYLFATPFCRTCALRCFAVTLSPEICRF